MGIVTTRIDDTKHEQLRADAAKHGRSVSQEVRIRIGRSDCQCDGRGVIGWHAGNRVYCVCKTGLDLATSELLDKMSILADDLQTMPICESNAASRQRKESLFKMLKAEHDTLQVEFDRLSV